MFATIKNFLTNPSARNSTTNPKPQTVFYMTKTYADDWEMIDTIDNSLWLMLVDVSDYLEGPDETQCIANMMRKIRCIFHTDKRWNRFEDLDLKHQIQVMSQNVGDTCDDFQNGGGFSEFSDKMTEHIKDLLDLHATHAEQPRH